jgi:hypothetical protein
MVVPEAVLPRSGAAQRAPGPPYAHAHWYFLAGLAAIVAGFWPSFFQPLGAGDAAHTVHGVTATLWIVLLAVQSWLMSRRRVRLHRRVAWFALALLPVLCVSALYMVRVMQSNPGMPLFLPPLLAFIDIPSLVFLVVLVTLALRNVRTPAAHMRYMSATVLIAFPPALTRLYARLFAPAVSFPMALQLSFVTVEVILLALLVADWRQRERRLAYPLSLAFFVAVHALMIPVSRSAPWTGAMHWLATVPLPF